MWRLLSFPSMGRLARNAPYQSVGLDRKLTSSFATIIPELHAVYFLDSWGINRTDGSPHRGHELGLDDQTLCPPLLQNEMLLGRAKEPYPASS
jgi:hypothetical protein